MSNETQKTKEGSKDLACMHCEYPTEIEHVIHKGTHIYICSDCPDVTFEFSTQKDIDNLREFLLTKRTLI